MNDYERIAQVIRFLDERHGLFQESVPLSRQINLAFLNAVNKLIFFLAASQHLKVKRQNRFV